MFNAPAERATPLSADVIREVLEEPLTRILAGDNRFKPGDEIIQPAGTRVYSIGNSDSPAIFVRYLRQDERAIEITNGEIDCLVAGVCSAVVGVWPACSWRFVHATGAETEQPLAKLSLYLYQNYGFVPLADVALLFPSAAEATRWFAFYGWSRELRRINPDKPPEIVFYDGDEERRQKRLTVEIVDGVVESVTGGVAAQP